MSNTREKLPHAPAKATGNSEVLARIRAGDAEALADYVDSEWETLERLCKQRLKSGVLSELTDTPYVDVRGGVVARVLEIMRRRGVRAEQPQQLQALFVRCVIDSINELNRRAALHDRTTDVAARVAPSPVDAASNPASNRADDLTDALNRVLLHVDPRDRPLLRMHAQGATLSQIAFAHGMTTEQTRKRIARAQQRVRSAMDGEHP